MEKSNFLLAVTESVHLRTLNVTLIYFGKQSLKTAFFNPWYTSIHAYGQKTRYTCKCSPPPTVLFTCNRIVELIFVIRLCKQKVLWLGSQKNFIATSNQFMYACIYNALKLQTLEITSINMNKIYWRNL